MVNQIAIQSDGKMPATEEQIKGGKHESLIVKSRSTSISMLFFQQPPHLSGKIKDLKSAKEMWYAVKADATTKSTLFILDVKDQLMSMKLTANENPKAHLSKLKQHFQLMLQYHNNLTEMGYTLSDTWFSIIMSSLPDSYWATLC